MRKKGYNYFEEFSKNSNYSVECAKIICEVVENFDRTKLQENTERMHEIEQMADSSKHEMMNYLLKDFLPPIEREDIVDLSDDIDEVIDLTEEILVNLDIFNVNSITDNIKECSKLLFICCEAVNNLITEFENFKKPELVLKKVIELNELESQGDLLYRKCMKNLYKTCNDPIALMIWTKIIIGFENCFDACEHVANDVETIIMKNS